MKRSSTRSRVPAPPERRRTILLWGGADSGKSGLIGALRSDGTKSVGERWAIDLDDASPDVVVYADSSSLALRLRGVKETSIRRAERAFTVPVRRYDGRQVTLSADLTVLDPQGELAADPASVAARRTLAASRTADAILWLVEAPVPGMVAAPERLPLLRQLVALLDAASATELKVPVIVALTKIDRLPAAEMRRVLDAPEESVRAALGDAAFGWLLAAFPRLRCFGFSA
ncbi:MAG TPA: GTPase domain-containing protein, partial [Gemmatimonadaceae bacterium]|nr:GTPase domain-containing protein [Gemmatimonadaceae bacterium]